MRIMVNVGVCLATLVATGLLWRIDRHALQTQLASSRNQQLQLEATAKKLRADLDEYEERGLLIRQFLLMNLKQGP